MSSERVGQRREASTVRTHRRRLVAVLGITVIVLVAELVTSLVTGSLALLADAGHMLTDSAGVGLALLALLVAAKPSTPGRSFGYLRLEILAALVNALLLFAVGAFVLVQAFRRLANPPEVASGLLLTVATVGLIANAVSLMLLQSGQGESLNMRGAYLEVLGDLLGSVAVIVAGIIIATTGYYRADSIASGVIALLIIPRAYKLLRGAVDVLLEAAPEGVDPAEVRQHIVGIPGVLSVHDLHSWSITSGVPVLSAHIVVDEDALGRAPGGEVLNRLRECLDDHFNILHCTFQLEPAGYEDVETAMHD